MRIVAMRRGLDELGMNFPWPVTDGGAVLDEALDIAMRYFDLPSNEEDYVSVEKLAADAIVDEWKLGVWHMTVLANKAIAAVEEHHPLADKLQPPKPS
jgi:hypothetical protein